MPTEDRRVGKLLPDPVTPVTTVCFTIQIPNAVQYRAAFLGQINVLGQALTWDHPRDGTECEDCEEAAQLWRNAIYGASWSDECGGEPMACSDVTDCIETDAGTQAAVAAIAGNTIDNRVTVQATYPPGQPSTITDVDLAEGTNPTCDLDITWAQCLAIAMQTNTAIKDVLEKVEVSTNIVELLDALSEVPLVGWVKEAIGGQSAIDLIEYYQEAVAEEYNAQYTETAGGVQDQIACALFCECKDDCRVTINRVYGVMKTRLEAYITIPTFDSLQDLIEFAAGVEQDDTIVVDLAFFFAWGSIKLGAFFFGRAFDITLSMLLQLSIDDASPDWITLCEDCADVGTAWTVFSAPPNDQGHITAQTTTSLSASSGAISGDGYYRISLENLAGCSRITSVSGSGGPELAWAKYYCAGGNAASAPIVNDELNKMFFAATSPFTITIGIVAI